MVRKSSLDQRWFDMARCQAEARLGEIDALGANVCGLQELSDGELVEANSLDSDQTALFIEINCHDYPVAGAFERSCHFALAEADVNGPAFSVELDNGWPFALHDQRVFNPNSEVKKASF